MKAPILPTATFTNESWSKHTFWRRKQNISINNDLFHHQIDHSFTLFEISYHHWHGLLLRSPFWIFSLCLNVPFGLTIKRTEGRYIQYMAEWRGITLNYITLLYITHTYKRRAPIKPTINETFQNIFHSFGSNISHPHPYVFLNFQIKIQKTNWHSNN